MDVKAVMDEVAQWLYPPRCLLCEARGQSVTGRALDLCADCERDLPFIETACERCALPLPAGTAPGTRCGRCQAIPPAFDLSFSLLAYQQPVPWLIQQLKFGQRLACARLLGDLFIRHLGRVVSAQDSRPRAILPVPLHDKRLRQRGFNQSIELARAVARHTGTALMLDHVLRSRPTEAQTGLDAGKRRQNVRGAFEVVKTIACQHVVIFDDVVTTASTVNELARVLKKAGVRRVDVWSIARAE